jgi:quercetin dioxygenase-like cupin family protein
MPEVEGGCLPQLERGTESRASRRRRARRAIAVGFGVVLGAFPCDARLAQANAEHIIKCIDSPTPRARPANVECAILVRKQINVLPLEPLVLRFEKFRSRAAAYRAETTASSVVSVAGNYWLLTLGKKGARSEGGTFVAEVGPFVIPRARRYEIVIGEVYSRPGAASRVHVHPGPEAWYLLTGAQCLQVPSGTLRAESGHGMFVAANTPMKLTVTGTTHRDAIFLVVGDAARPWTVPIRWRTTDRCG